MKKGKLRRFLTSRCKEDLWLEPVSSGSLAVTGPEPFAIYFDVTTRTTVQNVFCALKRVLVQLTLKSAKLGFKATRL